MNASVLKKVENKIDKLEYLKLFLEMIINSKFQTWIKQKLERKTRNRVERRTCAKMNFIFFKWNFSSFFSFFFSLISETNGKKIINLDFKIRINMLK